MSLVLSGCNAGLVILAGDDPGGWGSQNEQDSRSLALAAELPLLEPTTVADARIAMRQAFEISEKLSLPVMIRITRALSYASGILDEGELRINFVSDPATFKREYMRWVVLPVNVVPYHDRHLKKLDQIREAFEISNLNEILGEGGAGVITAGFLYQKLLDLMDDELSSSLKLLRLGTIFPFPKNTVQAFIQSVETVLVLEESAPVVERTVKEAAQEIGLPTPIYGRESGHVERVGELFAPQIATALNKLSPGLDFPTDGDVGRERPSLVPLCEGCPYIPTFDALLGVLERSGGRDKFIITGDPGCMVRAQPSPYELMDVKNSLGSGIGMGAGIALALSRSGDEKRVVALCGDSGLLHSGLQGLVDAVQLGVRMLVLILDNGTTALSGGQPHPGSTVDVRGEPRPQVDLEKLVRATGVNSFHTVDLDRREDIQSAIEAGMANDGVSVVVAKGECIFY
jgi:indolepyruvate ferredoxin oxidoreductase alpha subunit